MRSDIGKEQRSYAWKNKWRLGISFLIAYKMKRFILRSSGKYFGNKREEQEVCRKKVRIRLCGAIGNLSGV